MRLIKKNIQDIQDENEEIWSESKDLEEERGKFEKEWKELKNEILTLQDLIWTKEAAIEKSKSDRKTSEEVLEGRIKELEEKS